MCAEHKHDEPGPCMKAPAHDVNLLRPKPSQEWSATPQIQRPPPDIYVRVAVALREPYAFIMLLQADRAAPLKRLRSSRPACMHACAHAHARLSTSLKLGRLLGFVRSWRNWQWPK